jgi:hypothetical protein
MVDYVRAIKRPFTDFKKLIIGILLNLPIPLFRIITNPMALGYALNCGKTASKGSYELPEWKGYWKLWINGFVAGIIGIIYFIPAIILAFVFARDLVIGLATNATTFFINFIQNPVWLISNYGISILFVWVVSILIGYFVPIAMLNWIIEGKFGSAFDFRNIFKKVFTRKYFVAWLVLTLVEMGIGFMTLKLLPLSIFSSENIILKLVIVVMIIPVIEFIQNVFGYTVYGNVLEELKR